MKTGNNILTFLPKKKNLGWPTALKKLCGLLYYIPIIYSNTLTPNQYKSVKNNQMVKIKTILDKRRIVLLTQFKLVNHLT